MYVEEIVTRNDKKKGGAVNPCESMLENPISSKMVGKKTSHVVFRHMAIKSQICSPGRDEKPTLVLKYINFTGVSLSLQRCADCGIM